MAWQILGSFFSHYKFSCIPTLYKSPIMKKMALKFVSSIVCFRHFPLNFNRYRRGHKIRVRRELAVQDHFWSSDNKIIANIFCFQIRIICLFEEEMGVGSWLGCQVNKSLGAGKLRSNMLTFSRDCANFTTKQSWPSLSWDEKIATFFVPAIFFWRDFLKNGNNAFAATDDDNDGSST